MNFLCFFVAFLASRKPPFYCINTSYLMDNLLNRSAQTGPPNVRKRRPVFPLHSHCTRQVAYRTSFLSRQPDIIASFSFGACTGCTEYFKLWNFLEFCEFVALVSVVGVVDGQTTSGLSGPAEKKSKKAESKKSTTSAKPARSDKSVKSSSNRPPTTSSTDQGKSTTSSTDSRISDLDRKWSERFNRLEALLMAKTLDKPQDPVFSTVKVHLLPSRNRLPERLLRDD